MKTDQLGLDWIVGPDGSESEINKLVPCGSGRPLEAYAPSLVDIYSFWELVSIAQL